MLPIDFGRQLLTYMNLQSPLTIDAIQTASIHKLSHIFCENRPDSPITGDCGKGRTTFTSTAKRDYGLDMRMRLLDSPQLVDTSFSVGKVNLDVRVFVSQLNHVNICGSVHKDITYGNFTLVI